MLNLFLQHLLLTFSKIKLSNSSMSSLLNPNVHNLSLYLSFHAIPPKKTHFLCYIFRKTSNHRKTFEQGFMVQSTKKQPAKNELSVLGSAETHVINPGSITETANKKYCLKEIALNKVHVLRQELIVSHIIRICNRLQRFLLGSYIYLS